MSPASPPDTRSLAQLRAAAAECTACELYQDADQTVFGEGPRRARVMLVGEQPGDIEDRRGHVFVGPAGHLLDRVLVDAGFDRDELFLTNAVKHFHWKPTERGKRRIHQRPAMRHITACAPWLEAELKAVRPQVLVALGAVAGQALFGSSFSVQRLRGQPLPWPPESGPFKASRVPVAAAFATIHPSAVLRGPDDERRALRDGMVADLRLVREQAEQV